MTRTMDDNTKSRKQLLAELATLRGEMEALQRVRDDLRAELSELRDEGEQREGAPSEPLLFPTSENRAPAESAPDASLRSHQAERDQQLRDYRAILGTVVEGVISLDVTGKLVLSNAAARTMLHWRPFEFAEQLVHDRIHPRRTDGDVCRAENCPILRALASEDAASGEDVYFRSDGSSFPVHFTSTPWRVREQHAGAVFIFQDVSRQVRVEAQLAAARESFRATFEQLAVGIAHVTMSGKIRRANQCLAEMLGYARHELIDLRASALAHPDDYAVAVDRVGRLLGGEGRVVLL